MGPPSPTLVHIPPDLQARCIPRRAWICAEKVQHSDIFDNAAVSTDLRFRYTVPFVATVRSIVAWLDSHSDLADSAADLLDNRLIAAWHRLGSNLDRRTHDPRPPRLPAGRPTLATRFPPTS